MFLPGLAVTLVTAMGLAVVRRGGLLTVATQGRPQTVADRGDMAKSAVDRITAGDLIRAASPQVLVRTLGRCSSASTSARI